MSNEKNRVIEANPEATGADGLPLSPLVQEEIGRRLRAVYGKLAAEPLPDKFVQLLSQLARSEDDDGGPEREQ